MVLAAIQKVLAATRSTTPVIQKVLSRHIRRTRDGMATRNSDMRTDTEIRIQGLRALVDALGIVDAEKFISLILREPFDYTEWQQNLWPDRNVAEISGTAMKSRFY